MKRRAIAIFLAVSALICLSSALAAAGGSDDPLISLSYISGYSKSVVDEAGEYFIAALTEIYDAAAATLDARAESGFKSYSVARGGTVSLGMGGIIVMNNGSGAFAIEKGEIVDISTGESIANGSVLKYGHKYIAVESASATVNITAPSAVMLDGAAAVSQTGSNQTFSDVPESYWAHEYISGLAGLNLIGGIGNGLFNPAGNMTRADLVTILGRLDKVRVTDYPSADFKDVPDGQYYTPYVEWAAQNRIVTGYGDGNFGPFDNVTRDQMTAIVVRYCNYAGIDLPSNGPDITFNDDAYIQSWAKSLVYIAVRAGLVNGKGDGVFDPLGYSSRAEVCAVIYRLTMLP